MTSLAHILRHYFRYSVLIALVFGTALIVINHGDHLMAKMICPNFYAKCIITYFVPFLVSMVSGVLAARRLRVPRL